MSMHEAKIEKKILAGNNARAEQLRQRFGETGTLVVDLVSSPGSGKTTLLEATARAMSPSLRLATLVGDIATEMDAERLRQAGMPARQIITGGACHLDARLVAESFEQARFDEPLDLLFIENVGNLVCPASYALGEDFKVALLSVTEGHDKPFKYPAVFSRAAVTVLSKVDLLPYLDFDLAKAREQIRSLNSEAKLFELSVKSGEGMESWCEFLRVESKRKLPARTIR